MFSEATAVDPATAPIQFWTNGGPGCSGLEGFFNEMGIMSLSDSGEMTINPYSWNNSECALRKQQCYIKT
jgi:carboxypeptidase C (cathepsin A)